MPSVSSTSRPRTGAASFKWLALFLGLPLIGAVTVAGTYRGSEVIVAAGWLALSTVGILLIRPVIGVAVMAGGCLLAAYPTVVQSLGALTINNLMGVALLGLLVARILE